MCEARLAALAADDGARLMGPAYATPAANSSTPNPQPGPANASAPPTTASSPPRCISGHVLEGSDILAVFQHAFVVAFDFNRTALEGMHVAPVALLNLSSASASGGAAGSNGTLVVTAMTGASPYQWRVRVGAVLAEGATLDDLAGVPMVVRVSAVVRFNSTCPPPAVLPSSASPRTLNASGFIDKPVSFSCTLLFPPAPVVSATTQAVTQAAIATSVAASAMAGPSSASDIQSMVLMTLSRCASSGTYVARQPGGYKLLTPFALSDTARGALGGNALALGAVTTLTGVAAVVCRFGLKQAWPEALATARFPGFPLLFSAALHQSTLFCGVRLCGSDRTGPLDILIGGTAVLLCCLVPLAVLLAVTRVPRRFLRYSFVADPSRFASLPLSLLVPFGTIFPRETRLMSSSLITAYTAPSVLFAGVPFLSSFVTNLVALLPESTPSHVCNGMMYASAAMHLALGVFIGVRGIFRHKHSTFFGVLGIVLTASFHAQLASGMREGIDPTMTLQAGLSLLRSVLSIAIGALEQQLLKRGFIAAASVVWEVLGAEKAAAGVGTAAGGSDGSGLDDALLDNASLSAAPILYLADSFASGREGILSLPSSPALSATTYPLSSPNVDPHRAPADVEMTPVIVAAVPAPPPPVPAVPAEPIDSASDDDIDLDALLGIASPYADTGAAAAHVHHERLAETELVGDTFAAFTDKRGGADRGGSVARALLLFGEAPPSASSLPPPPAPVPGEGMVKPPSRNYLDDEDFL